MNIDLAVETEHSRYDFDTEQKLFTRTRVREEATDFNGHATQPTPYDSITGMTVGERMTVFYAGGRFLHSTPVTTITDHLQKAKT